MKHTKGTLTAKKITVRGKHGTYQRSVMVRAGGAVKRVAGTRMGKALGSALVAHATFHGGARAGAKLGTGGALVGMVGGHIAGAKANKALFKTRGHKRALLAATVAGNIGVLAGGRNHADLGNHIGQIAGRAAMYALLNKGNHTATTEQRMMSHGR